MQDFIHMFNFLGDIGPNILFVFTLLLISSKINICIIFVIGYILNFMINRILKRFIHDKRPNSKKNNMPSGHSQCIFYSIIFFTCYFYSNILQYTIWKIILGIYLLIALNTINNSIQYNYHTIDQVIIGSIIGSMIGYFTYLSF